MVCLFVCLFLRGRDGQGQRTYGVLSEVLENEWKPLDTFFFNKNIISGIQHNYSILYILQKITTISLVNVHHHT